VVGQLLQALGDAVGIEFLDRVADFAVQFAPALAQQAVVDHVLDQRVSEDVRGFG